MEGKRQEFQLLIVLIKYIEFSHVLGNNYYIVNMLLFRLKRKQIYNRIHHGISLIIFFSRSKQNENETRFLTWKRFF